MGSCGRRSFKKNRTAEDGRQTALAAGLALCVFAFLFLVRDLFPVGDGSVVLVDLHSQYVPLLYRFYDVVTGEKNLFLDLSVSGGAYLYADTVNELLNPFNYILFLFGRERIWLAVNVLLACYGAASAASACFCLQRLWPGRRVWNVPLSLCYALSGYMAAQFQIIRWMYFPVLFPLFLLALLRLLKEKKWGFYALLLGYQLALSLQLGAMTLLFTLFGSGFWFLYHKWEKETAAALAAGTAAGLLLSSAVLVPNLLQLLNSVRAGENQSYLAVMRQHGLGDLFERLFLSVHPLLLAAGVVLLLRGWRKAAGSRKGEGRRRWEGSSGMARELKLLLLWNGFLLLTVAAQPSNLLWHLGSYMCFPVRYAYMLLFSQVLLVKYLADRYLPQAGGTAGSGPVPAAEGSVAAERKTEADERSAAKTGRTALAGRLFSALALCLAALLCAAALALAVEWSDPLSQAFSSLAVSGVPEAVKKLLLILAVMFGAGLMAAACAGGKGRMLTFASCVMGAVYFLCVLLPQDYGIRQMNEAAYRQMTAEYEQRKEEEQKQAQAVRDEGEGEAVLSQDGSGLSPCGFIRREDDPKLPLNAPLVAGGSSMTGYFPSGSGRGYAAAMKGLGYLTPWVSTRSQGGTVLSDRLLGIVREEKTGEPYAEGTAAGNGTGAVLSAEDRSLPGSAGMPVSTRGVLLSGVLLSGDVQTVEAVYEEAAAQGPLAAQEALGRLLTGETVLERAGEGTLTMEADGSVSCELAKESVLYLDATETAPGFTVWVNEKEVWPGEHTGEDTGRILCLGSFAAGEVQIRLTGQNGETIPFQRGMLGILDVDRLRTAWERIETPMAGQLVIRERKGEIRVSFPAGAKERSLFLPVAWQPGWSVTVNGEPAQAEPVFGGFLGVELPAEPEGGETEAVFRFLAPGLKTGLCLTALGCFLLAAGAWTARSRRRDGHSKTGKAGERVQTVLGTAYVVILTAGVLGIYLIPNAGLAVNVLLRLSGVQEKQAAASGPSFQIAQIEEQEEGIRVQMVEENLMLDKRVRVKADSEEGGSFKAELVKDGVTDEGENRWSSENDWEDNEHWLQADFSREVPIVCVKLYWERTNVCEYALEYSGDGREWKSAAHFQAPPAEKEQTIWLESPIQARYLRLHVWDVTKEEDDLSLYYQNVSLHEMEVYGKSAGSLLIQAEPVERGYGRRLKLPQVPEPYSLRFGGADYANVVDEDGKIADTLSGVEVSLGFILERDGMEWELPGLKVMLPGVEEAEQTDRETREAFQTLKEAAEWKAAEGWIRLSADMEILPEGVLNVQDQETLERMAVIFEEELSAVLPSDEETRGQEDGVPSVGTVRLVLTQEENHLGEEGCELRIGKEEIRIRANTCQGIRWGCITLLELLEETKVHTPGEDASSPGEGAFIPQGTLRDYPRYEVRGFGIDVGRRPISMELLREMVKELSRHRMNTLQIHLNDNQIISQSGYDGTLEGARSLYAGFRLESDLKNEEGVGITSTDLYYTKEEFMDLIEEAAAYGVEIVPEIDTPAHSLALTRVFPELGMTGDPEAADMLDLSKREAVELGKTLWKEYLTAPTEGEKAVFADCPTLHLGMDEYFGDAKDYLAYLEELTACVARLAPEKELRIWGSLSMKGGDLSGISRGIQMQIWDTAWADPEDMYEAGFSLIHSLSSSLYLIPGGGYDWLDLEFLQEEWEPNVYSTPEREWVIPDWSPRCLGACYMMWNDWAVIQGEEITEEGLLCRFREPLPVIADKLW